MTDEQDRTIRRLLQEKHEPIAIVGMGLRFPGGNNTLEGFEEFLAAGGDGIVPLPTDRWDLSAFLPEPGDEASPGKIRAPAAGFLEGIDQFDPGFFNIAPKEAHYIDPQQRILLETAWQALESANIDPHTLRHGNGGVYIGASSIDYAFELDSLPYEELDPALSNGITIYPLSGRLSYFLGWRGPSLSTDTACASSLTALHLAVQGLRRQECDIALAGAVNCLHHPKIWVMFSQGEVFAADGHCKTFDDAADGYARAEGCGVLVLKRLSDAQRDGDTVLALVRGTAIGQDGESAGLTAPNGAAQEIVIRSALANAQLTSGDIQYVEAHGTGTPLGDPIEMGTINGVFGASHSKENPVVVGSLKTNLGHMEPAAGIGGVVKTVLQMRAGSFFPHLVNTPSRRIPWDSYPVELAQGGKKWDVPVRRAVINGFGFAGAIGAAVLEQAPTAGEEPRRSAAESQVFTVSAKSRRALKLQLRRYQEFLAAHPEADTADLCYTGNVGRAHFPYRVAGVVHDRAELSALLERELARADQDGPRSGELRRTAFLFSGSGAQQPGMGSALYAQFPVFREQVDACDRIFEPLVGLSIRELLIDRGADPGTFHDLRYNQPLMFTFEYALARLWLSWGVRPSVLIGHSTGELIAATVAGLFDVPDAARLMAARGALLATLTVPGGMAAVAAEASEIEPLLAPYQDLGIGAVNSPGQCVLSGGRESLDRACADLRERGYQVTELNVPVASHSSLMAEIAEPLRAVLREITFREPEFTLVSNVTGQVARPSELSTPDYWIRHLCETLNFADGMRAIERRGRHVFIEIGPSSALTTPAAQCVAAQKNAWLVSAHPEDAEADTIRQALAELYLTGLPVNWRAVHTGRERAAAVLPHYAFDRKRYWLPNDATRHRQVAGLGAQRAVHPLLGEEVALTGQGTLREFSTRISAHHPAYLAEHTVGGRSFYPVAGYLETLLALQDAVYGETRRAVEELVFHETLFLSGDAAVELRIRLAEGDAVEIAHRGAEGERVLLTARFGPRRGEDDCAPELRAAAALEPEQRLDADAVYAVYRSLGLDYGPRFRQLRWAGRVGADLVVGEVAGVPADAVGHLPPTLMDAATHTLAAVVDGTTGYVAVRCAGFRLFKKPKADTLRAVLRIGPGDRPDAEFTAALLLLEGEQPVFELEGLAFARLPETAAAAGEAGALDEAEIEGLLAGPRRQRLDALETLVRTLLAEVIEIDDADSVERSTRFIQLGLNSLLATQLRARIEGALGLGLPAASVLQHPSVELLAEFLDRRLSPEPVA
ncbi:acyl transferase domain-containing protein [Kitasatospora sp. MAA4]|uniref:type I polyketide synthase n=1 Tax=Kitasatospora sp. MAA4 TaxID=3035093 RepID=UPI0024756BCA|nr:beta-ketoacyl synthase N-terminal-like domain-containing protein [Kitasatospora sp. MAA4]MDH6135475.1 acyl transferase domain-containing protein [Kitasatospora sp. MAA4]